MPINTKQLKIYVVEPVLEKLQLNSPTATNLLLGTCAQESHMGTYIHQLGKGPALGIYQMEPATHDDIVENYIQHRSDLKRLLLREFDYSKFESVRLLYDLQYATVFARLHYRRVPKAFPAVSDLSGLAAYWKQYYNTYLGAGTEEEFINNWKRYVANG